MATQDRILQIERTIVAGMERELKTIMTTKKKQQELDKHRQKFIDKSAAVELKRKQDQDMITQENAEKAANVLERRERVMVSMEERNMEVAEASRARQERADSKQARIIAQREAANAEAHAEAAAKRDYVRQVREQLHQLNEERKEAVLANMDAHDLQHQAHIERIKLQREEKCAHHRTKEEENRRRRERHKFLLDQVARDTSEKTRKKFEQAETLLQKQAEELEGLRSLKEEFANKKREIRKLTDEAHKTGDLSIVTRELDRLNSHKEDMGFRAQQKEDSQTPSPAKQFKSTRTSPASTASPGSPQNPNLLSSPKPKTPGSGKQFSGSTPGSAPRQQPVFTPQSQSPRGKQSGYPSIAPEDPPPGGHYDRLMDKFRQHMAPPKRF